MRLELKKSAYFIIQLIFVTIYSPTALSNTIHVSQYTIFANIYIYLHINKFSI